MRIGEIVLVANEADLFKLGFIKNKYNYLSRDKKLVLPIESVSEILGKEVVIVDDDFTDSGDKYYQLCPLEILKDRRKELNRDTIECHFPGYLLKSTCRFFTNYFIGETVYSRGEKWIKKNWYLSKTNLSTSREFIYKSPTSGYFVYANDLSEICSKQLIIKEIYFDPDYREFVYLNVSVTEDSFNDNLNEELLLPSLEREANKLCKSRCIMECEDCKIKEILEVIRHKN